MKASSFGAIHWRYNMGDWMKHCALIDSLRKHCKVVEKLVKDFTLVGKTWLSLFQALQKRGVKISI